jgi:SAM-dependent methyltransferase
LSMEHTEAKPESIYANRRLVLGHPAIEQMTLESYRLELDRRPDHEPEIRRLLKSLDRLVDVKRIRKILVVGCGPRPETVRVLRDLHYEAVGLEPVKILARAAREYMGEMQHILEAPAEDIPFENASQDLVIAETVLEHVDSLERSLAEMFRILVPGGLLYVYTTNRLRFSLLGRAEEFKVPFYNWLPDLVKECFVFQHLHFDPTLAHYTSRPAVHWYSYAELCKLGRRAGFSQFYSVIDLVDDDDRAVAGSRLKRALLRRAKFNPWVRALALSQYGGAIVMWKRPAV